MVDSLKATRTVFTVSQFLDWQRAGTLNLNPIFQRRPVWKLSAKSQFIDSIVRGYPIPIILLRRVQDLDTLSTTMEVVDGQQRLRTLLAYVDSDCLHDLDEATDLFKVRKIHNKEIAAKRFRELPKSVKEAILSYELSTHVLPATTSDELVFRIFARLNSTGLSLKPQEIRNAEWHGVFKSLVYDLSFQNLACWRAWKVFSGDAISRMDEAEAVSEYLLTMLHGITGKSHRRISEYYKKYDESLPGESALRDRFEKTISAMDKNIGQAIPGSPFRRAALFYSLFAAIYDHLYGLGSPLKRTRPKSLPANVAKEFLLLSARIRSRDLDEKVQDAMDRATGDKARRDERHSFIMRALGLESSRSTG